jgi:hypothetical protein
MLTDANRIIAVSLLVALIMRRGDSWRSTGDYANGHLGDSFYSKSVGILKLVWPDATR